MAKESNSQVIIKPMPNNEHNALVFGKIAKLEAEIKELKTQLKSVEKVQYTSLADCNAMTQKNKKLAAESAS